jgi:Ca-activated chloride channel family protein
MQWGAANLLHGLWLWALLAALTIGLWRWRERRLASLMDPAVLAQFLPPRRRARHIWRLSLWTGALLAGLLALARPQWGERWIEMKHMGLDILVVLDTSNSMRAQDIRPDRLGRAKLGIRDLLPRLQGDRIGLIAFAGSSHLLCPVTADYGAFMMMLDDTYSGIIPRGGTAIEQALQKAMNTFDEHILADRVILLITDGEDHEGNPLQLIDELRRRNIRVYAVGIGSPEGDLIPVPNEQGSTPFLRDAQGQVVKSTLQEDVLERIATRTGGIYVRATPGDFGLERIYEQGIRPLQREALESQMVRLQEDRFVWFAGTGFILLLLACVIRDGKTTVRKEEAS